MNDLTANRQPTVRQPSRNSGTLMIKLSAPTLSGRYFARMVDIPVTPPGARSYGRKKLPNAQPAISVPSTISR